MPLSKPEDIDDRTEMPDPEPAEPEGDEPMVQLEHHDEPVLISEAFEEDVQWVISRVMRNDQELREQEEAIKELQDTVRLLAEKQGEILSQIDRGYDGGPLVRMEEEKLL